MKTNKIFFYIIFTVCLICLLIVFFYNKAKQSAENLPQVAIIIDDWGYNLDNIGLLRSIDIPLTLAVLPNLIYSKEISNESRFKNRSILLHMPMEPESDNIALEKNTLLVSMDKQQMETIFQNAIESIGIVKGVSNHMGSKFTSDERAIKWFFEILRNRKIFFVDNLSSENSLTQKISSKIKVKNIKRDVFLDNKNDINYIKSQINELISIAMARGYAVGTGHDRKNTLLAIKDKSDNLKGKVKFVFVSQLVK